MLYVVALLKEIPVKMLFMIFALMFSVHASAEHLFCASKKNENMYYTTGQIRLTAQIADEAFLTDVNFSGAEPLGFVEDGLAGKKINGGRSLRFQGGDAWCSYDLIFPANFTARSRSTLTVKAYCEENTNSTHILYCTIK